MTAYDVAWDGWFATEEIEPLQISYEALCAGSAVVLQQVLESLGLTREAASGVQPGFAKLADNNSWEWVALFRSEPDAGCATRPSAIPGQGPRCS